MSNVKISNLPLIPSVSPDDVIPIVDSGFTTTYKVKVSQLAGTSGTSGTSGSSGSSGTSGLGFNWQGGWQSITTYYENDVVYYSGASYVALGTIPAGGNPPDINASWENMNAQGASGTNGTSGSSGSSGTSGTDGTSGTSGVNGSSGTSGTSGQSNSVYSGGTSVVVGATILNFVSGATITDAGGGQANITIQAGSTSPFSASGSTIYPTNITTTFLDYGTGNTYNDNSFTQVIGNNNNTRGIKNLIVGANNTHNAGTNRNGGLGANMIIGYGNNNSDSYSSDSLVVGLNNGNAGWGCIMVGANNNTNYGLYGSIVGQSNTVGVEYANVFGYGNQHTSQGGFTIGYSNINQGYAIFYETQFIHGTNNQTIMANNTAILGGRYNQINGIMYDSAARPAYDAIIGGNNNTIGTYITGSTIVGSSYSTITGSPVNNCNIIGGTTNKISGGGNNGIFGGNNNTNSSTRGIIIGGESNNNSATDSVIVGGNSQSSTGSFGAVVGGYGNNGGSYCGMVGGYANNNYAEIGFIHGNQNRTEGQTNGIIGAEQSKIFSSGYASKHSFIGGGFFNVITNSLRTSIVAGQNNSITSSPDSTIIGGTGNTISNLSNAQMMGCVGRTAIIPDATHLEQLVLMRPLTEHANNAAAKAAGLVDGQLYRDNTGQVHIVFT